MKIVKKNPNFHFLILALLVLLFPILTFAHPGGLGADGCHVCKTNCEKWGIPTGEKHCHGSSAPSPAPAPQPTASPPAGGSGGQANPPPPPVAPPPTPATPAVTPSSPQASEGTAPPVAPSPPPTPPPNPNPVPPPSRAPVPSAQVLTPSPVQTPPPAPPYQGGDQGEVNIQASEQTASPFFTKSSTIWLFSAVGVAILAALGFIASRRV